MLNDTQVPAPRVRITNDDQTPTREWFRFFSNLYDFIGLRDGVMPATSGGTGYVQYAVGDTLYADTTTTLARRARVYGSFYSTASSSFTADTSTIIPVGSTLYSQNLTLATNAITVAVTGTYLITARVQLTNANAANDDDFFLWLRVNGADVADTACRTSVLRSHGGTPGSALLTATHMRALTAADYFEIYGLSKLGYANVNTYASSGSPAYPQAPGVVITVSQVM